MFIPHTDADRATMLRTVGIEKLEDLFTDVPAKYRFPNLDLPPALTEMEISQEMQQISMANETVRDLACFLGAGVYNHYVPAAVDAIIRRGEFFTAYTPYQP
jgi:glycine dehydrogenase subunit 1